MMSGKSGEARKDDGGATRVLSPARAISGFPEYLPAVRRIEQRWLDTIRSVFESYGFASIETPSVEEAEVLASKGSDVDKEIYGLTRLAAGPDEDKEARIALHYDLTVPLARYVAQHYNDLAFPFKRYQIQKAWRGERPQEGRFREFVQCDIDVIDHDHVSHYFDIEMPRILLELLDRLDVGPVHMLINNRKILEGFYRGLGIADPVPAIRIVDKIDKLPHDKIAGLLVAEAGLTATQAQSCLALARIRTTDTSFVDEVRALGVASPLLDEGLKELADVIEGLSRAPSNSGTVYADLSIARGFDYYTGVVYEGKLADFPDFSSVCSGGRYDNLVGQFIKRNLPGIGVSLGLTRIFGKLLKENRLTLGAACPTDVMVAHLPGQDPARLAAIGAALRGRGVNVEVFHEADKIGKQIRYASRKGIAFVWFATFADDGGVRHEIKNLETGEQVEAALDGWRPPRLVG